MVSNEGKLADLASHHSIQFIFRPSSLQNFIGQFLRSLVEPVPLCAEQGQFARADEQSSGNG